MLHRLSKAHRTFAGGGCFLKINAMVGFAVPKIQDAQVLIGPSGYKMVYKVPEVLISIYIFKENNI